MFKFSIRKYLSLVFVLALVLTASFGSFDSASAAGEVGLARAIAAQEAHTNSLMEIEGVVGTAVGPGSGNGHVVLALTESAGVKGLPGAVDGVVLRPYVTGKISAQPKPGSGSSVDPTASFERPVPIGVSTGHTAITAGTIGARVVDSGGNVYALSNNHVYANENDASPGDPVIQPGTYDGGSMPSAYFGTLDSFVPISFSANNTVDAAIAAVDAGDLQLGTPEDGYGVPSTTTFAAAGGMSVLKYGRTTGQTEGRVDAINATVNVAYTGGTALFIDQIIIKGRKGAFSAGGDSGSLIVTKDGKNPVALLFAGNSTVTIANPIDAVLSALEVSIDDGNGPPPTQNDAPVVSIDAPLDGTGYDIGNSTTFVGTANDTEDGDLTAGISWTSSIDGPLASNVSGAGGSVALSLGTHTITASVTDSGGKTGSASITVVVTDPDAVIMTMSVGSIDFSESRKGRKIDLNFTISIVDEGGSPVSGAAITSVLSRPGDSWNINGTTGSAGTISGKLSRAIDEMTYTITVNDVTHSVLVFAAGPPPTESWLIGGPN